MGDSVMFSDKIIITEFEEKGSYVSGNARGNDIVDAKVEVVLLKYVEDKENHKLRRMIDLKLVRNSSPLFKLTTTVMHIIDENTSVGWKADKEDILGLVVTMTGYDATYSSTAYTRMTYSQRRSSSRV